MQLWMIIAGENGAADIKVGFQTEGSGKCLSRLALKEKEEVETEGRGEEKRRNETRTGEKRRDERIGKKSLGVEGEN
jgi:hypothetical protein